MSCPATVVLVCLLPLRVRRARRSDAPSSSFCAMVRAAQPEREGVRRDHRSPQGDQDPRVPRGDDAGGRPQPDVARPQGARRAGAGEGSGIKDAEYVAQGATIVPTAADAWGAEMVVKVKEPLDGRVRLLPQGPRPLHVPAPRGRAGAHEDAREERRRRHRVRDHPARGRRAAAAQADERGRGAHGRAGRRDVPREGARRQGRAPRRRARARGAVASSSSAAASSGATRRPSRSAWARRSRCSTCAATRWRTSRTSSAARSRRSTRTRSNIEESCMRADLVIGAVLVTGARGAEARQQGARRQDEQGQRHRRRRGRPGRLHRDLPPDDARPPDLRGRRRRPLLRRQHAGRGAAHEHLGADEHDHAVRGEDRRAGPRRGGEGRQGAPPRASTRTAGTSRASRSPRRTTSSTCRSQKLLG